jgi:WhiB family transcriptional regulator, redox-sensing transcriptional regulator
VSLSSELIWQDDAACAGEPLRYFFPPKGVVGTRALIICSGCSVRLPCLAFALTHGHGPEAVIGVWGGTTQLERRKIPKLCASCRNRLTADVRARYYTEATPAHRWLCERCAEISRNTRRPDGLAAEQRARQARERWGMTWDR